MSVNWFFGKMELPVKWHVSEMGVGKMGIGEMGSTICLYRSYLIYCARKKRIWLRKENTIILLQAKINPHMMVLC